MKVAMSRFSIAVMLAASVVLAGCVAPYRDNGYRGNGYQGQQYDNRQARCNACGVVQDVQQVYVSGNDNNNGALGAVIGAVAGGLLGHTIGKGDGRTATTVVGAVAGGVIGNKVAERNSGDQVAWRIVVRLENGQYATVTQRDNPRVRNGDYVELRDGHVYQR